MNEQQLIAKYGRQYANAEYQRGDCISFFDMERGIASGMIVWACSPMHLEHLHLLIRYIVSLDNDLDSDNLITVYATDVIQFLYASQEPTLVHCPYCNQWHCSHVDVEQCPLKPKK